MLHSASSASYCCGWHWHQAYQHYWYGFGILDAQNLFIQRFGITEALAIDNAVHQHEALTRSKPLVLHRAVLFLSSCITERERERERERD
jgi:hypothetical protein